MKHVRQADRNDIDQINTLRITEFQRSGQFTLVKPEKLKWNCCDDAAIVLSAWDGQLAVATMRAVLVFDKPEAEKCVQCVVSRHARFPAMVFNSAATCLDYRGNGLNQLMRYHFLRIALECGIQSLLSPMYHGAPRIRFMEELGYQFTVPSHSWQSKLDPKTTRILGELARSSMPQAMNIIETQRRDVIRAYPWYGKRICSDHPIFNCDARLTVPK